MIPKVIYFTCCDKNRLHQKFRDNVQSMQNKYKEYELKIYDHKDIDNYFENHINGKYYRKINQQYGAVLSDYFRYNVLFDRGGIYLDIKSYLKNLDFLEEGIDGYVSYWKKENELWNGFLVSKKDNPILKQTIQQVNYNIMNYDGKTAYRGVMNMASPKVLTKVSLQMMNVENVEFNTFDINGFKIKVLPNYKNYVILRKIAKYKKYYVNKHYGSMGKTPIII
jgi:mannosyltransferase OCH1-like enzyme